MAAGRLNLEADVLKAMIWEQRALALITRKQGKGSVGKHRVLAVFPQEESLRGFASWDAFESEAVRCGLEPGNCVALERPQEKLIAVT